MDMLVNKHRNKMRENILILWWSKVFSWKLFQNCQFLGKLVSIMHMSYSTKFIS